MEEQAWRGVTRRRKVWFERNNARKSKGLKEEEEEEEEEEKELGRARVRKHGSRERRERERGV